MRILGVDPGSLHTGYGVIDVAQGSVVPVDAGVIAPPAGLELVDRLTFIASQLAEVARAAAPDVVAIENIFTARSPRSALVLGQARGAAMVAVGSLGVPVVEVAPSRVKSLVAGHGRAGKTQVARAVRQILHLEGKLPVDASDALAIALSVAFHLPGPGATLPRVRVRKQSAREAWNQELRSKLPGRGRPRP
ncbi:MAG: crossover junction endodeoxyribonuclease RuvC [Pseudomonadota bacterium]